MEPQPERVVYKNGLVRHLLGGVLHREDGPAETYPDDGPSFYYWKGKLVTPEQHSNLVARNFWRVYTN